jgi:hypothetical protein
MRQERVIYDSALDYDRAKEFMQDTGVYTDDDPLTDDAIWQQAVEDNEQWFDDERMNLDVILPGKVIAIINAGLWNGRRSGYIICDDNLNEVLTQGNHDFIRVYSDGYNIQKTSMHHDGTNYITFRMIRPEMSEWDGSSVLTNALYFGKPVSARMLRRYTTSLLPYVKKVYGW